MRAAAVVKDILGDWAGLTDAWVYTIQPATLTENLPNIVVTTQNGYASDERTGVVVTVAVDTHASTTAAAEDLGWVVRAALLAAVGHRVRSVRTLSVPTPVALEGQPAGLARCTATYALSLPIT